MSVGEFVGLAVGVLEGERVDGETVDGLAVGEVEGARVDGERVDGEKDGLFVGEVVGE